jgi:hypothetical protein
MIILPVGPNKTSFAVHKKVLLAKSDYFEKVLNGRFKEDKTINLPEDNKKAIACFIDWAHCGCISKHSSKTGGTWEDAVIYLKTTLYPAYLLGVKFLLGEFENVIIDTIQAVHYYHEGRPDKHDIELIFKNTPEGNKFRVYCAAIIAWSICNEHFRPQNHSVNKQKLIEHASLSSTIDDFALELILFQGRYDRIFYETPRLDPRSHYNKSQVNGFMEGFGATFFHNPGYKDDGKGKKVVRGTPRQNASPGGSGGLVTGAFQSTAGSPAGLFAGNAGAPPGSALASNTGRGGPPGGGAASTSGNSGN